jgi:hypothetical protein
MARWETAVLENSPAIYGWDTAQQAETSPVRDAFRPFGTFHDETMLNARTIVLATKLPSC